jgi:hypothetical protein
MSKGNSTTIVLFFLAACLFAFSQASLARNDDSLNGFRNHALSVLVRVNAQGKVTDVQPSVQMTIRTRRLLRANLDEMIVKPAMIKGHPVSSMFVVQLALHGKKKSDGTYQAHFSYVSSLPVPSGTWYWAHIDGHRLALVEDEGGRYRHHRTMQHWAHGSTPFVQQGTMPTPASQRVTPAFQSSMPVSRQGRPASPPVR